MTKGLCSYSYTVSFGRNYGLSKIYSTIRDEFLERLL